MQIGSVLKVGVDTIPQWAACHPHVASPEGRRFNTIYVSAEAFTVGGACKGVSGAGVFGTYHDGLCLTAHGRTRSIWSLPGWFYPSDDRVPLGYHGDLRRWSRDGDRALLQTVGRGQEFVLDAGQYPEAIWWARSLVTECSARTGGVSGSLTILSRRTNTGNRSRRGEQMQPEGRFFAELGRLAGAQRENQLSRTFAACFNESPTFRRVMLNRFWQALGRGKNAHSPSDWRCSPEVRTPEGGGGRVDFYFSRPVQTRPQNRDST